MTLMLHAGANPRRRIGLSYSFTGQPYDLDQQEAPNQQGRESDKPKNDSPHGKKHNKGRLHSFLSVGAG